MTAEIAILNRLAVVLAADSAVTVRVGQQEKVYNSADKIFELCDDQPVGLMFYNTMDFMGVPWEVLIRKFRVENKEVFKSVADVSERFLEFISKEYPTDEEQARYFGNFASNLLGRLNDEFINKHRSHEDPLSLLQAFLEEILQRFETFEPATSLNHVDYEMFDKAFGSMVIEIISHQFFFHVDTLLHETVKKIVFAFLKSEMSSELVTGLVFAGFGEEELFPSLLCLEVDGFYFGKHKIMRRETVDIDRAGVRAAVVPFAQREMVDRFLSGIDLDLQYSIEEFVQASTEKAVNEIIEHLGGNLVDSEDLKKELALRFGEQSRISISADFFGKTKQKYVQDINDMVMFMPKPEMVTMAESLVNFTSIKRRVSLESETVGGPVDVAVISKNEGFVWVRRKHYFTSDRNPRYFQRKNNQKSGAEQ